MSLLSEIHEQPAVLARLLAEESDHISSIAARIRERAPRYLVIAARGTSDNAARYAQYLFGARNRLSVALATPSLYTLYTSPPRLDGALVVGISQSGASPDLVAVLAEARRQDCATLAITNEPGSPLAQVAGDVIGLHAGPERSVAATKTYTAQLLALAMLSGGLGGPAGSGAQLARVPGWVEAALGQDTVLAAKRAAALLSNADRCVVIGRGFNYATTFELALKLKELAYVAAEPYSSADFMHGPVALVEADFPVLAVNPGGAVFAEVQAVIAEVKRRGARPIILSERDDALAQAAAPIVLPDGVPEWLSPIVAIAPGQLLAAHASLARGFDPDQPRGLQKVTRTL